jgi:hypothetical protein
VSYNNVAVLRYKLHRTVHHNSMVHLKLYLQSLAMDHATCSVASWLVLVVHKDLPSLVPLLKSLNNSKGCQLI